MLLQTGLKQARNYGLFEIGWIVSSGLAATGKIKEEIITIIYIKI
jgi:hypothetical protein